MTDDLQPAGFLRLDYSKPADRKKIVEMGLIGKAPPEAIDAIITDIIEGRIEVDLDDLPADIADAVIEASGGWDYEMEEDDEDEDDLPPDDEERDYLAGAAGAEYDVETRRP